MHVPINNEKYIYNVLLNFGHNKPTKFQLSSHKHRPVTYCAKSQISPDEDIIPKLNEADIKRVHVIFGALLYYAQDVDNKLPVALSTIGAQKSGSTE